MGAPAPLAAIGWKVIDRFHLGGSFAVSPHGVGIALGFLAGAYLFLNREAPRRGYPDDAASTVIFWALVGAVVGSRLGYVFTHFSEYRSPQGNLLDILKIYQGGLSQLGGVAGAILLGYLVVRRHHLPLLPGLDAAALGIPLGVIIGRVGDLIIGDHLGKPTSWALAFRYYGGNLSGYDCFPAAAKICRIGLSDDHRQVIRPGLAQLFHTGTVVSSGVGVHQTALYDLLITMGLLLFLVLLNGRPRRAGVLFFTYVIWYGAGRIVTDFLRVENRFFGLTGSQWTSVVAVMFSIAMLHHFSRRPLPAEPPSIDADRSGAAETAVTVDPPPPG
jgi:phosphatidylglycerol:prolipoprotein diacylglycerol transferase